jgi:hypothetical protein
LTSSFGKTAIGALIAGKTNKAELANPAMASLNPKALSLMVFLPSVVLLSLMFA